MTRSAIWKGIAEALTDAIRDGHYAPGDKLPTEAQLATRFGVNRHTVRHALAAMAEGGLVHPRRGAGVFVAARPTAYPLGRRVRFQANLAASGRTAAREITLIETRAADSEEAAALDLRPGDPVHVVEGVSLADSTPLAVFRSVFPATRLPGFRAAMGGTSSITQALSACGVADYTRRDTQLTAKLAPSVMALRLRLAEGAPILRTVAVNIDPAGQPIEYGTTWFAGDRVTLTVRPD
jgi:GntR family transcriptional regulator, phosphonate transport system regulatory protein